jgi:hypothetical protein
VAWQEWSNGDGSPGGSIINRHMLANSMFKQSWFAVKKPNGEAHDEGLPGPGALAYFEC